ncbi:glycosyltransferase involved in cell wall biosynthesis [Paucimonas lemoignei]|uniref:Glycosyltransferase involved in cell wall biosynthesis n=1 Tax=Paucimonas lemoignei TaxID=29443 RepID=A0A4R3HTG9_PAULE|nr:glycosyltransferase family 4 protein [Paucimonas lemoignei]TCS35109.1 glycosyltransferase involved in cell wall biosynthesis [Paucimonas lemoignei]
MKLLVVSQYFWPENFRINDLVAELVQRGHEVTILTGYPNYPDGVVFEDFRRNPGKYAQYAGADIIRVPLAPRGKGAIRLALNYLSFVVSASLLGLAKLRGRKFDHIFVYEPSPITVGLPAIVMKWVKKAPITFWVLDLWPETLRAVGMVKSERVLRLIGHMVSFIYRRCDVILAQSQSFIGNIRQYCHPHQRVEYFPSWAEDMFGKEVVEPAPELAPYADCFKIVFAGNIGEAQDFPAILDAAEHLKARQDIQWILVGDGRMGAWVADEIKRRGLTQTVSMLGRFPLERMPSFYASADALLVTLKKNEIFSMTIPGKVQSYLAAGKPILGMLDGEGAAAIFEAKAGKVCPAGNGAELAKIVQEMADSAPSTLRSMGEAGNVYYREQFERNTLMTRIEQILLTSNTGTST